MCQCHACHPVTPAPAARCHRYYSPGFPDTLLDLIEGFEPQGTKARRSGPASEAGAAAACAAAVAAGTTHRAPSSAADSIKMDLLLPELLGAESRSGMETVSVSADVGTRSCASIEGHFLDTAASRTSRTSRTSRRPRKARSRTLSRPRQQPKQRGVNMFQNEEDSAS